MLESIRKSQICLTCLTFCDLLWSCGLVPLGPCPQSGVKFRRWTWHPSGWNSAPHITKREPAGNQHPPKTYCLTVGFCAPALLAPCKASSASRKPGQASPPPKPWTKQRGTESCGAVTWFSCLCHIRTLSWPTQRRTQARTHIPCSQALEGSRLPRNPLTPL